MFKWMAYRLPLILFLVWTSWIAVPLISCTSSPSSEALPTFPETCAEVQEEAIDETGERPADGTYTLYIDNDENLPWDAYCYNMNRSEPLEFITVNEADNYSQIGSQTETGSVVAETSYRRLRIDPISLTIDPLDDTFASSDFDEFEPALPEGLESIPAGWAEMQPTVFNSDSAEAYVSLADTPFAFDESILENGLADFFCSLTTVEAEFEYEIDGTTAEVDADLKGFHLTAIHINSMGAQSGEYSREIADCDNLSNTENVEEGIWPLTYVGE